MDEWFASTMTAIQSIQSNYKKGGNGRFDYASAILIWFSERSK